MTAASATVLTWCLITLALIPFAFACVLQWRGRRTKVRTLTLDPRLTNFGGVFLEPTIDLDELERKP